MSANTNREADWSGLDAFEAAQDPTTSVLHNNCASFSQLVMIATRGATPAAEQLEHFENCRTCRARVLALASGAGVVGHPYYSADGWRQGMQEADDWAGFIRSAHDRDPQLQIRSNARSRVIRVLAFVTPLAAVASLAFACGIWWQTRAIRNVATDFRAELREVAPAVQATLRDKDGVDLSGQPDAMSVDTLQLVQALYDICVDGLKEMDSIAGRPHPNKSCAAGVNN